MLLIDAVVIGASVVVLTVVATYAYLDAPEYGMDARKWAAISFFVPIFGFFAYLFEREERTPDEDRDMFVDRGFEVHESRADDMGFGKGASEEDGKERQGEVE